MVEKGVRERRLPCYYGIQGNGIEFASNSRDCFVFYAWRVVRLLSDKPRRVTRVCSTRSRRIRGQMKRWKIVRYIANRALIQSETRVKNETRLINWRGWVKWNGCSSWNVTNELMHGETATTNERIFLSLWNFSDNALKSRGMFDSDCLWFDVALKSYSKKRTTRLIFQNLVARSCNIVKPPEYFVTYFVSQDVGGSCNRRNFQLDGTLIES